MCLSSINSCRELCRLDCIPVCSTVKQTWTSTALMHYKLPPPCFCFSRCSRGMTSRHGAVMSCLCGLGNRCVYWSRVISGAMPSGVWWRCEVKKAMSLQTTSPFCLQWWHHPPCPTNRIYPPQHICMCTPNTPPHTLVTLCTHFYWRALHVQVGRWWFCCPVCELEWCSGLIRSLVCRSALFKSAAERAVCHSHATRWRWAVWHWWSVYCVGLTDSSAELFLSANHSLTEHHGGRSMTEWEDEGWWTGSVPRALLCNICLWLSEELGNLELWCWMWIWRHEHKPDYHAEGDVISIWWLDEIELFFFFLNTVTVLSASHYQAHYWWFLFEQNVK